MKKIVRIRLYIALSGIIAIILLLGVWAAAMLYNTSSDRQRAAVTVGCKGYYELLADGKPVLVFRQWNDRSVFTGAALSADSLGGADDMASGVWVNRYALLPSCRGRVLTAGLDIMIANVPSRPRLDSLIAEAREYYDSRVKVLDRKADEMGYYLRVHSVSDPEYNTIAMRNEEIKQRLWRADSIRRILSRLDSGIVVSVRHISIYHIIYKDADGRSRSVVARQLAKSRNRRITLLQTADRKTPSGVSAMSLLHGTTGLGFRPLEVKLFPATPNQSSGVAVWSNTIHRLRGLTWHGPRIDTARVKFIGTWSKDSLITVVIRDSSFRYEGQVDSRLRFSGHGLWTGRDRTVYEGQWKEGERSGFGYAFSAKGKMRVGEWRNDRFYGERLEYSSDRIYGIDISKYQHIKGRHRYAIDWSRLRVSSLGHLSRKSVRGTVDFPVSFVYIKSTEGATLRNPYYGKDYLDARRHGFHVGSYHFFSTRSDAVAQANFFVRNTKFSRGDFPPVLDVEPLPSQIRRMGGVGVMFSRIRTWLRLVGNHCGVKPVLYVSQIFVNRYLPLAPDLMRDYDVWIARYGEYKPDVRLVYWQLCPDGGVRGIHGKVDINVFNGYAAQFDDFKKSKTIH